VTSHAFWDLCCGHFLILTSYFSCARQDSKIYFERNRLLGIECDEIIHSILDVMYANAPYTVIQRAMHIHPTVTELIPTMLGELKPLEWTSSKNSRVCAGQPRSFQSAA
jgi:hypothetical protein